MPSATRSDDPRSVAGAGLLSLAGASFSALMGFVLTFVLARTLGDDGAGVVLQVMAIFMIALSIARLGMDTAAVWYLPRLVDDKENQIRGAISVLVLAALVVAGLVAAAIYLLAPLIGAQDQLTDSLRATSIFVPIASVYLVILACSRALGGIGPYIAIGSVVVPLARPVLVIVAVAATGSAMLAATAWAAPFALGLLLALLVVFRQVRRHEQRAGVRGRLRPSAHVARKLLRFSGPRVLSTTMEQALIWLDVILVGVLAGAAAAGVYGSTSRFLAAALLIDTAIRAVVSPIFSRLVWRNDLTRLRSLFTQATTWLVLFSMPINVMLFVFAPLVLSWLGPAFTDGTAVMRILAAGMAVILGAGNVHSLLLMSGRSGWAAANKAIVLTVNVVGNIVFIPRAGIEAAAVVWSACMLIDAALATIETRRFLHVSVDPRAVGRAYLIGLVPFGIVSSVSVWLIGQNLTALVVSAAVGGLGYACTVYLSRRTLQLTDLRHLRDAGKT